MPHLLRLRKILHTILPGATGTIYRSHTKKPTAQPWNKNLHTTAILRKLSLHVIRFTTKINQTRRDIERNPQKYLSNTAGVCRFMPPNHLIPTEKPFLFYFSDPCVLCVSAPNKESALTPKSSPPPHPGRCPPPIHCQSNPPSD
jgi:hypothetical protein